MSAKSLILLSAGGTGGHVFPAAALAKDLVSRGYDVALATDKRGKKYEAHFDDVPFHVLNSGAWGSGIIGKISGILAMGIGYFQAASLVKKLRPTVVVGFGGYPSVPAVFAAQRQKILTVIHEQNAVLGKANAFLAPKADRVALSLPHWEGLHEADAVRAVVVGNPVRQDVAELYTKPYPALEEDGLFRIFIMGGSLGATIFSEIVPKALAKLPASDKARLEIVQQCRVADIKEAEQIYKEAGIKAELAPFFDNVAEHLGRAHLFIGRSGASTVAEVTTAGRPAIFVPYPHHKDQQQKINARSVADRGGAWLIEQDQFTQEALLARIETFFQEPEKLFRAAETARSCGKPDAARKLGNLVTALAAGWDKDALRSYDLTQGRTG